MRRSPWKKRIFYGIWIVMILLLVCITVFSIVAALRPSEMETKFSGETVARDEMATEEGKTEGKSSDVRTTEEVVTEASSTEKPATEESSTEKPATEESSTEAPTEQATTLVTPQKAKNLGWFFMAEVEIPADGGDPAKGHWLLKEGQSYYIGADSQPVKSKTISWQAHNYYLDEKGYLVVSEKCIINDCLYEASEEGILTLQKGWVQIDENKFYGTSEGKLVRNKIVKDSGKEYYLDTKGVLITDQTLFVEDKIYTADKDGVVTPAKGWVQIGEDWYYAESDGKMAKEQRVSKDNLTCYLDSEGKIVTSDFYTYNGDLYFAEENGGLRKKEGWFHWQKRWYYSDNEGKFVHDDFVTVEKEKYYMDSTGARIVGKPTIDMYLKCPNIFEFMTTHHSDLLFQNQLYKSPVSFRSSGGTDPPLRRVRGGKCHELYRIHFQSGLLFRRGSGTGIRHGKIRRVRKRG